MSPFGGLGRWQSGRRQMAPLRPAAPSELKRIWRAVRASGLYAEEATFRRFALAEPFRVLVSGDSTSQVVVTKPWRRHLPILAVQFVAAMPTDRGALVEALAPAASEAGFEEILSPMLIPAEALPFVSAGYVRRCGVLIMAVESRGGGIAVERQRPSGVEIRFATEDELEEIARLDMRCFDEFWRYGPEDMREAATILRTLVAAEDGQIIGYAMGNVIGRQGNIVRLGVDPERRHLGIGSDLLSACARDLYERRGRRMVLCTQSENRASQRLYSKAGFAKVGPARAFYVRRSEDPPQT